MPRHKRLSPQDKLVQEKVKAERLKRQKIEASLPPPDAEDYSRIEDLPPLHPEDEAVIKEKFYDLAFLNIIMDYNSFEQRVIEDWYLMDAWLKGDKSNRPDPHEPRYTGWDGITHNGDHPWLSGKFLDIPRAKKFADKLSLPE